MARTEVRIKDNRCKWPKCGKPIAPEKTYCNKFCHRRHVKDRGHADRKNAKYRRT